MNFFFKIGVPTWREAEQWGDYHFVRALSKALEKKGHVCRIQVLPEWKGREDGSSDVTVHIKGLSRYKPKPGPLNVMWLVSHPRTLSKGELEKYDLIFVASDFFADRLEETTDTPVRSLLQFADTDVMYPVPSPDFFCELLFLGNSRLIRRAILTDLMPTTRDLHVWGADWNGLIPSEYLKGEYFPYEKARRLYSSSKIVLNDHWRDMRQFGFVNNRIFDALACKAFVLTDSCIGLDGIFPGGLVSYREKSDLERTVDYYLNHPEQRKQIAERGYGIVLEAHTVEKRVEEMLSFLNGARKSPPKKTWREKMKRFFP